MTHQEYANSLRLIAEFFEEHTEIPLPYDADQFKYYQFDTKEEAKLLAHALGTCDKHVEDDRFELIRRFGAIRFIGVFDRSQVCERVVTGTTMVERQFPVGGYETRLVKEDIVEWKCPEALLK